MLCHVHSSPPRGLVLITGADKARDLAALIEEAWPALGKPCSPRAVDLALRFARLRAEAFDPQTAVLAHGDAHAWNTPRAPGGGFKFIDPFGLVAERAYDLSISMREWSAELFAGDPVELGLARCALLARLGGVDPEPIWQWGMVERVANGLLLLRDGLADWNIDCLAVADAWARRGG